MVSDSSGGVTISATNPGDTVEVNGSAIASTIANFSNTTPAAPAGTTNVLFQKDALTPTDISASMPLMVGDSGAGGVSGAVPAPAAGNTAAGDFLRADGTWQIPPGTGGAANYQSVENNGSLVAVEPSLNFFRLL